MTTVSPASVNGVPLTGEEWDALKRHWQGKVWQVDDFTPTEAQATFLACQSRLKLVAGGVRAGKSKSTSRDFDGEVLVENGLIWIVGPDYEQGKPEWRYLLEPLIRLDAIEQYSEAEKGSMVFVTRWGCRVQTKSSKELITLASFAPNAILMVEAGQQPYEAFLKCQERALEHYARVTVSGTFEGALSWYPEMFEHGRGPNEEGLISFSIPSWSNTVRFPGGRDDPKIKALEAILPEDVFMERCAAVPYKPTGLVFGRQYERGRHVRIHDYDPTWPIELAIDPAQHTYAVLAIQWNGQRVKVIDEIYEHDATAYDVIPIVKKRPWWPAIQNNAGVMDIAGTQRLANKSQLEIWQEEAGKTLRSHYVLIPDGIDALKLRLSKDSEEVDDEGKPYPLLTFDYRLKDTKNYAGKANGVLAELGLFRWPEWTEGKNVALRPIDANCDSIKALWYWLYDRFGPVVQRTKRGSSHKRRGWF